MQENFRSTYPSNMLQYHYLFNNYVFTSYEFIIHINSYK